MGERREVLVDTQAAAHAVGVSVSTIKMWQARGKLEPVEHGTVGGARRRNLYRLRDVRIVYREQTKRTGRVDTRR